MPPRKSAHTGSKSPAAKVRKGHEASRIYGALREKILTAEFAPGAELDESVLERMFAVSRTPVREALIRLASDGLVRSEPNRSAIVAPIGIDSLKQFFEAFDLLQRAVTRWCAVRRTSTHLAEMDVQRLQFEASVKSNDASKMNLANKQFHMAIAKGCQNEYLSSAYDRLLSESYRLSHITYAYSATHEGTDHLARIISEHAAMIKAIRDQDAPLADTLAHQHAILFRTQIEAYMRRSLSLDIDFGGR